MTEARKESVRLTLSRRTLAKAAALATAGAAAASAIRTRATSAAQEATGGTLTIGKPYELSGFDPHPEGNQTSWEIHAVVYESLVFLDDSLTPVPGLAERWEAPDDRTYTLTLRQGVKFHNGREMTSDDVVFSLQRVLTLPEAWWDALMAPPLPPDPGVALGTPQVGPTVGLTLTATGPYEVTATLTEPYAPFLAALTGTTVSIVPGQEVRDGVIDLTTQMIGTGPFMLTEHLDDQRWIFDKFSEYWQEGKPTLDRLVWQVMPDEAARVAALRSGEVQLAMFENPTMLDLLAGDANITTVDQPTTNYYILFVNAQIPTLADARVRQAISAGIDREQIRDVATFGHSNVTGPVAVAFSELAAPLDQVPYYTRDVDQAKQLLADAGYGEGLAVQLLITPVLAATVPMAELIKAQLAEVGIEVEIVQRDLATFVNEYAVEGTAQLTISWWAGYSDPSLILLQLSSTSFGPLLGAADPELDELLADSYRVVDPTERIEVLHALERKIAEMANFQPMVTRNNFLGYRNDLVGGAAFAAADGFGLPLWRRVQDMTRIG